MMETSVQEDKRYSLESLMTHSFFYGSFNLFGYVFICFISPNTQCKIMLTTNIYAENV